MRLVLTSDTHGEHDELTVPDGDVLIHAGDMSGSGEPAEIREFGEWLQAQPHKYKIVIAGNHDFLFEDEPAKAIKLLGDCHYLLDRAIMIAHRSFYGSPYTPRFFDWALRDCDSCAAMIRTHVNSAGHRS